MMIVVYVMVVTQHKIVLVYVMEQQLKMNVVYVMAMVHHVLGVTYHVLT